MYIPEIFRRTDKNEILEIIQANPFATVITWDEGAPFINHLPLYLDNKSGVLIGHLAKANPQAKFFDRSCETIAVFHGPHGYVSPRWYRKKNHVPTWNYAAVHIRGKARSVGAERLVEILDESVLRMENDPSGYRFSGNPDLGPDFKTRLLGAIQGFEIPIEHIEAKFKLSQNRDPEDYAGVLEGLRSQTDDKSRALLALMLRGKD